MVGACHPVLPPILPCLQALADVEQVKEGWSTATVPRTGLTGMLPTNYITIINSTGNGTVTDSGGRGRSAEPGAEDQRPAPSVCDDSSMRDDASEAGSDRSSTRPSSGKAKPPRWVAEYDYVAADDGEVSVMDGDELAGVESLDGSDWCTVTVLRTGATGMLPSNYITDSPAIAIDRAAGGADDVAASGAGAVSGLDNPAWVAEYDYDVQQLRRHLYFSISPFLGVVPHTHTTVWRVRGPTHAPCDML